MSDRKKVQQSFLHFVASFSKNRLRKELESGVLVLNGIELVHNNEWSNVNLALNYQTRVCRQHNFETS